MKATSIFIMFFIISSTYTFAQFNLDNAQVGDTIYYDINKGHTSKETSCFFSVVRNIKNDDNNKPIYNIDVFKIDSIETLPYKITTTFTKRLEIIGETGFTVFYHKNGQELSKGFMNNHHPEGIWNYWHDNGLKRMEKKFYKTDVFEKMKPSEILNYWNEDGSQTITNGNGSYYFKSEKDSIIETGGIKKGVKDGRWEGFYGNNEPFYIENYKNGKLINGESWDKEGTKYLYKEEFTKAQFKHGQKGVRNTIVKNFIMPKIVETDNIQGTVLVSFIVNTNGNISEVKAYRKVHPDLDAEAIRLVKLMKDWIPATKKGKKIKTKYNLPITFRI